MEEKIESLEELNETPTNVSTPEENQPVQEINNELPEINELENKVEEPTPVETFTPSVELPTTTPDITNKTEDDYNYNPKPKKKKAPLVLFIILLLLVAVAGGVYYFVFNGEKTKVSTDNKVKESKYRLSDNSLSDFDLKFMQLENNQKNMIYSPLSIKYTLAMLKEGTAGDSNKQINNIIGDYKSKKYINSQNMSLANAMFIRDTYKDNVKEEYSKKINEKYNAEVIYDSFQSPDNLNKWVSDKTFNLINNLFDDVSDFDYSIVNALAIDMNWNNQIQCATGSTVPCIQYGGYYSHEKGKDGNRITWGIPYIDSPEGYHSLKFNGKDNIKSVEIGAIYNRYDIVKELGEEKIRKIVGDEYKKWLTTEYGASEAANGYAETDVDKYLDQYIKELNENYDKSDYSSDYSFYNDENVKVFAKDLKEYDGTTLQYVGIMPKNQDLNEYVKNTNSKEINKVVNSLKELKKENFKDGVVTKVYGYIPMFKFDYELKLMSDLKKLGIKDVFSKDKANLSKLTNSKSYIASAAHKANIEFSNDGIKAAAATQMSGAGSTSGGFDYFFEVPVEEIDLTFDKPYMFLIRDKATGEVWFTGTVYEPITK